MLLIHVLLAITSLASANPGSTFTYQGQLSSGNTPINGTVSLRFTLFDADTFGAAVGTPSTILLGDVFISGGLVQTELDFGAAAFDGSPRWLEIELDDDGTMGPNGFTTLTPRVQLLPVPYAIRAGQAAALSDGMGGTLALDGHSLNASDGSPVDALFVDAEGDVGIGTTSPGTPLSLRGNGGNASVGITQNQVGGTSTMELTTSDNMGGQATRLLLRGSSAPADIEFYTGRRGEETQTLIIEGLSGRVGIGTDSPAAKLHVSGGTGSTGLQISADSDDGPDESEHPVLTFTQDGGSITTSLGFFGTGPENDDFQITTNSGASDIALMSGANVGVGTTEPNAPFHVVDSVTGGGNNFVGIVENTANDSSNGSWGLLVRAGSDTHTGTNHRITSFQRPDGTEIGAVRQISASTVDFFVASDERLKGDFHEASSGLAQLLQIDVLDYEYKDEPGRMQIGFLAQQLAEIYPDAVSIGGDDEREDPWMVSYNRLVPLLVKSIQDQQAEIEALQERILELEQRD